MQPGQSIADEATQFLSGYTTAGADAEIIEATDPATRSTARTWRPPTSGCAGPAASKTAIDRATAGPVTRRA